MTLSKKGFTMIEIMGAIAIIGILISAVWVASGPYFARSRDTQRITDMTSLGNVFMAYRQNMDIFPSVYGSGGNPIADGYCVSEMVTRIDGTTKDMKFTTITKGGNIPKERGLPVTGLCDEGTSYSYTKHSVNTDEYAFLASSLENHPTSNLGNHSYLVNSPANDTRILELFTGDKNGIDMDWGDSIYYVSMK